MKIYKDSNFEVALKGETIVSIIGAKQGSERVEILTKSGKNILLYHMQDCYESVTVYDIRGRVENVIDSELIEVKEKIENENPSGIIMGYQESFTWTTFTFKTINGILIIRWYGESDGYYSESVNILEVKDE